MTACFLIGALCDAALRDIVLGRPPVAPATADDPGAGIGSEAARARPARLAGYSVYSEGSGPLDQGRLCATPGTEAEGCLVTLSEQEAARLSFYLGAPKLSQVEVQTTEGPRSALAAIEPCDPQSCGALWDGALWSDRWTVLARSTARSIMAQYGQADAGRIAALRPYLAARSWAQHLARHPAPATLRCETGREAVEIVQDRPGGHEGFFRLRTFDIRHRRFDGALSATLAREGFVAYDAALVLPYDPVRDEVLMIEQLRYGPILREDPLPWVLEPVAGLVDAGESPDSCALREAVEEAGLHLRDIRPMLRVYSSPGYSSEFFHCFLGVCDLGGYHSGLGGLESEHEDIRSHVLGFDRAMALVDSGEINAAPLAMMLLWLAREREGLRAGA